MHVAVSIFQKRCLGGHERLLISTSTNKLKHSVLYFDRTIHTDFIQERSVKEFAYVVPAF